MELLFGTSVLLQYTGTVGRSHFSARVELEMHCVAMVCTSTNCCQGASVDASGYEFLEFKFLCFGLVPSLYPRYLQAVRVNTSCTERLGRSASTLTEYQEL